MVLYECKTCKFSTFLKTDYNRHKNTKKHRRNCMVSEDMSKEEGVDNKMSQNEPQMSQNEPQMSQNEPQIATKNIKNTANGLDLNCEFCGKLFSTKANKRKHELHRCTKIPTSIQHNKDINEWRMEKNQLYKQIDALIAKAGNTTTNNLNLNSYGNEDLSHLTDSFKTGLLKGPFGMIPKMIEAIHFNNEKPENKNISLTNKKENKIKIFKNGKWAYCKKTDILEDIMHNNYYLLDAHYDDIGNDILNDVQKLQYSHFKDKFSSGEIKKSTKEDINLVLLNSD